MAVLTNEYTLLKQVYLGNTGYSNVYLRNYAKVNSQDIANNRSNVSVQLRIYTDANYWYQQSGGFWAVGLTDNTTISGQANRDFYAGETILGTLTGNVSHNADGTKECACLGSINFTAWGWTGVVDTTATLPTIPRATACPNLDGYIESSIAISLNPASTSFKHRLYYNYNGKTGYYPSSSGFFDKTGNLSIDSSFYQYTSGKTGSGTLTLYTYNSSGTLIGSKTGTLTIRCDESKCKPTISATIIDVNSTTTTLTGDNNKIVKGFSNARITYTLTAKNNATISSKSVNGSTLGNSPYTINSVSTGTFIITATDSRGFSNSLTINKTLINYIPLSLNLNVFRTTPTGSEVKANFTGTYFNGSFGNTNNSLELSYKVREKDTSVWLKEATLTLNTDYKISGNGFYSGNGNSVSDIVIDSSIFNYQKIYEVFFYFKDRLVNSLYQQKIVTKGVAKLSWDDDYVYIDDQPILTYDIVDTW